MSPRAIDVEALDQDRAEAVVLGRYKPPLEMCCCQRMNIGSVEPNRSRIGLTPRRPQPSPRARD
jgi:hypothetical protein